MSRRVADTFDYDLLNVSPSAPAFELQKPYRLVALLNNPDKNPNDVSIKKRFQDVSCASHYLVVETTVILILVQIGYAYED